MRKVSPSAIGARGWRPLDLEHRRRAVSGGGPDRRPLSCQAALKRSRKSSLRSHRPTRCSMGGTPKGRTRHRKIPGTTHRHPSPGVPLRGRASLSPLFPDQPTPHVLSGLPCARLVYFHGRCRGRVQSSHRHTAQTSRNALDCSRLQRHHRSPLCQAEWSLSGLLGTQNGTEGRMTHHFLGVHPRLRGARHENSLRSLIGFGRGFPFLSDRL